MSAAEDAAFMAFAAALGERARGTTWPNPAVGCVIAAGGRVVGQGFTQPGGRPHAETEALSMAGQAARGATAYVTLEPCSHHGQTPPCAEALIAAGIARIVVAHGDPDQRVNGAGLARLRGAGIAVTEGIGAAAALPALAPFLHRVRTGRPRVTLKLASTLDGRIATHAGESQWITGEAARRAAHALRGRHDAVLVGAGTAAADDPDLTCRIPGFTPRQPVRVVFDTHVRIRLTSRLAATADRVPIWVLHGDGADPMRLEALSGAGVRCIAVPRGPAGIDPAAALTALGAAGLTSVLCEGGASSAAALLRGHLVDELVWFHAPAIMGGDGFPAVQPIGAETLAALARFRRVAQAPEGDDLVSTYHRDG